MTVAKKILLMLLMKAAPQDLPFSTGLMLRVIILYIISSIVVLGGQVELPLALGHILLSIAVTLSFSYVVLSSLNLKARFVQTVTALVGTGIAFNLLIWPVLNYGDSEQMSDLAKLVLSLVILMIVSWEVLVTAHIYRNALSVKMTQAVLLSMALFFVSLTLTQLIFPESS